MFYDHGLTFLRRGRPVHGAALLPAVLAGWPVVLVAGGGRAAGATAPGALARIRSERLFWPAPRASAPRPFAAAFDLEGLAAARAAYDDEDITCVADPADIDPERLEAVFGGGADVDRMAQIGGLAGRRPGEPPEAALATASGVCPWTTEPLVLPDAVEAQALLRAAAMRGRGPVRLIGMSRWKRRCLRPFLTGPDGPPRPARPGDAAGPTAVWGVGAAPEDALRVEDGFLRSVGLGLRHTPPISLAIAPGAPHFDATRRNAFEETVARTAFAPDLLDRAARLRARLVSLGLTKYNLPDAGALPDPGGRLALLAPGQVGTDASIRLGATAIRTDGELLEAARRRFPGAFILYKPHPDVLTGLREGADVARAARIANHVETVASAEQCLRWADRVATISSLTGFEALLRETPVTTFGRPFYAGWGLTDDADPPVRDRKLDLDALVAAALILHAAYIDPRTGLPAPPEIAVDRLVEERSLDRHPIRRLRRAWRYAAAWLLNSVS